MAKTASQESPALAEPHVVSRDRKQLQNLHRR